MKHVCLAALLGVAAVWAAGAADAPYFGKWKLDPAKSQVGNETYTFEKTSPVDYRYESQYSSYSFRLDGKEYPRPGGGTTSWKALSPDVWECTNRAKGTIVAIYEMTVKGDVLSAVAKVPQSDGKSISNTSTAKRISGGPGFVGKWRVTDFKAGEDSLELTAQGDGLLMRYAEERVQCAAAFDGKPYPLTGEAAEPKTTLAFRKTGPGSFEVTMFTDGKPTSLTAYRVSADGRVLTEETTSVSKKATTKFFYERQ